MLVFVARPDALAEFGYHSPAPLFSLRRVGATASSHFASCRSRNLGTAFRSPATALSPPLRGHRSRPAPSIPHHKLSRSVPLPTPALRSVSRPIQGAILAGSPFPAPI